MAELPGALEALLTRRSTPPLQLREPGPSQAELARARLKSYNDCMVAAGAAPPGGVQPVDRALYGTGWY